MYGVVLLVALSGAEGSAGYHKGYPTPVHDCPWCYPGYHNHGGWGLPYGGYGWPGYACWGGCSGYASAAYGVPMTPLITPRPPYTFDRDEKDKDDNGKDKDKDKEKKKDDGEDKDMKKDKPKKKDSDDGDDADKAASRARVTFLLPAGAKLFVDGAEVKTGDARTFRTPALEWGHTYYYEVKAEVVRDGKPVSESRRITLKAGATVRADFRSLGDAAVSTAKK